MLCVHRRTFSTLRFRHFPKLLDSFLYTLSTSEYFFIVLSFPLRHTQTQSHLPLPQKSHRHSRPIRRHLGHHYMAHYPTQTLPTSIFENTLNDFHILVDSYITNPPYYACLIIYCYISHTDFPTLEDLQPILINSINFSANTFSTTTHPSEHFSKQHSLYSFNNCRP